MTTESLSQWTVSEAPLLPGRRKVVKKCICGGHKAASTADTMTTAPATPPSSVRPPETAPELEHTCSQQHYPRQHQRQDNHASLEGWTQKMQCIHTREQQLSEECSPNTRTACVNLEHMPSKGSQTRRPRAARFHHAEESRQVRPEAEGRRRGTDNTGTPLVHKGRFQASHAWPCGAGARAAPCLYLLLPPPH